MYEFYSNPSSRLFLPLLLKNVIIFAPPDLLKLVANALSSGTSVYFAQTEDFSEHS
jgi:hypothetical protein